MPITIDDQFGWPLLGAVGIAFHVFTFGFRVGGEFTTEIEGILRESGGNARDSLCTALAIAPWHNPHSPAC